MKKYSLVNLAGLLLLFSVSLSSCQAIADIFKAGVWVGVIIVVVIIVIIFWLVGKSKS